MITYEVSKQCCIQNSLVEMLEESPTAINDCLMIIRVPLMNDHYKILVFMSHPQIQLEKILPFFLILKINFLEILIRLLGTFKYGLHLESVITHS